MGALDVKSFRDLEVWHEAIELTVECYKLTDSFPTTERYGLVSQIRRAANSIPSNVAEGHNRKTRRAFLNHVRVALGSEAELETDFVIAVRLGFCSKQQLAGIDERHARVGRMLHGLSRSLKRRLVAQTAATGASCVVSGGSSQRA
jgi:four helix bundle protein